MKENRAEFDIKKNSILREILRAEIYSMKFSMKVTRDKAET